MSWVNTKCAVESINDGDVLGIFLYGYDLVRLQPENGYTRMMPCQLLSFRRRCKITSVPENQETSVVDSLARAGRHYMRGLSLEIR